MIFNTSCFDQLFKDVITNSSDSFPILHLKEKTNVHKETNTVLCSTFINCTLLDANWINPEEKQSYEINGRLLTTDVTFFITGANNLKQGDTLLNLKNRKFYDVLGLIDYDSHFEVDCSFIEKGANTNFDGSAQSPYSYLNSGLASVV